MGNNGDRRWTLYLVSVIQIGLFCILGYTWAAVVENRQNIQKNKETYLTDIAEIKSDIRWIKNRLMIGDDLSSRKPTS